jgi:hypothetical protein
MKYVMFLGALLLPSVGCAATFHSPYYAYDDCEYEYVYVPTKKIVTVYGPGYYHHGHHKHKRFVKVIKHGYSNNPYSHHFKKSHNKKIIKKTVHKHSHH